MTMWRIVRLCLSRPGAGLAVWLACCGTAHAACPVTIYMSASGRMTENRFHGNYRVSRGTLARDLQNGCKEGGPVSSVTISASPKTAYGKVKELLEFVQANAPAEATVAIEPATVAPSR